MARPVAWHSVWLVALTLPLCPVPAQDSARSSPDSVRRALDEYATRAEAQGVSGVLLVASRDDVMLHRAIGWRNSARSIPNDTTTLFYIASIAKQFVAAAILQLEDAGRLRTTDAIARFFPEAPAEKRSITVDQLLAHTSGLGRYGFDPARRDWAVENREQATRGILGSTLAHEPGTQFDYQNTNYLLLGEIVERVSGVPLDTYLDQRLFAPAGLRETYVGSRVTNALRPRVAWSVGDETESFSVMDRAPSWLWHGRGVLMTAADLCRWVRALDKGLILSPTARRKLFTIVATLNPGYGYGRGWFVRADSTGAPRVVFHGGDFGAYHSEVRLYPVSGPILVAFTNAAFRGSSMTETVLNQMLDVVRGDPNPLPPLAAESRERAASIAGEYRASKHDAFIVTARGTSLSVEPTGQRASDWLARGDTSGWRDRQAAGERALALVDALNRGTAIAFRGVTPEVRRELADEWDGLTRVGGRLKSIQLLGTVTDANGGGQLSIVRLKFQRDSLLYGVGWAGDSLRYTSAGIQNRVAPRVFAPTSGTEWVSFGWSAETQLRFATDGRGTMTLQTSTGPIVLTRNRE